MTLFDPDALRHVPLTVTPATTRAEIQAEIQWLRTEGRRLPAFADDYAERICRRGGLLDQLLAREPEPV